MINSRAVTYLLTKLRRKDTPTQQFQMVSRKEKGGKEEGGKEEGGKEEGGRKKEEGGMRGKEFRQTIRN